MQKMIITPIERKIIDTEINGMIQSGYGYLLGSDDPVVMGKLFKKIGGFFKKIGKGVGGLYSKIKQRMKERGISASVGTPESSFSVGPEGMQIATPKFQYDSRGGTAEYSDAGTGMKMRFKKGEEDATEMEPLSKEKNNKMILYLGAAAIALVAIVSMKK